MPTLPPTLVLAALAVTAVACAESSSRAEGEQEPPVEPRVAPAQVPERVPQQASKPAVTGEAPQDLIDKIRADLGTRIGEAAAREANVVRSAAVTWNDGGLGCPEPGQMYTQALVPGYHVELEAGGRTYSYHANRRGFFKLCEASAKPAGG